MTKRGWQSSIQMIEEVCRQYRTILGLLQGIISADYSTSVDISKKHHFAK